MQHRQVVLLSTVLVLLAVAAFVVGLFAIPFDPDSSRTAEVARVWRPVAGALALLGFLWIIRRCETVVGVPVAAESIAAAVLLVLPWMLIDLAEPWPCAPTLALVALAASVLASRRRSARATVVSSTLFAVAVVLRPQLLVLSAWLFVRKRWVLPLVAIVALVVVELALTSEGAYAAALSRASLHGLGAWQIAWAGVGCLAVAVLIRFGRGRRIGGTAAIEAKELALALGSALALLPLSVGTDLVLLFPAAVVACEATQRSCVVSLKRFGKVATVAAILAAWAAFALWVLELQSPWLDRGLPVAIAILLVAPVLHRRAHPEKLSATAPEFV